MTTGDKTTKTPKTDSVTTEATAPRKRKKVYERQSDTDIPQDVIDLFLKDNYELRWVRWQVHGEDDFKSLARREREGYELVRAEELPSSYIYTLNKSDTKNRQGLVTSGDVCLMKIDVDLRNSRKKFYNDTTKAQVDAVNINVLQKKGFKNLGTKTRVVMKEPSFQD